MLISFNKYHAIETFFWGNSYWNAIEICYLLPHHYPQRTGCRSAQLPKPKRPMGARAVPSWRLVSNKATSNNAMRTRGWHLTAADRWSGALLWSTVWCKHKRLHTTMLQQWNVHPLGPCKISAFYVVPVDFFFYRKKFPTLLCNKVNNSSFIK